MADIYVPYKEDQESPLQYDRHTRLGFIKKVYGILSAQLIFTCIFVMVVMNC